MARALDFFPRFAIFLAGVAAGALTNSRRDSGAGVTPAAAQDLKQSLLAEVEARLVSYNAASASLSLIHIFSTWNRACRASVLVTLYCARARPRL